MKIANIKTGILPIPPNGWGAIEKLIWELHCNFLKLGHDSKIVYLDELTGDEDIVHIHVGNLANLAHERGIPYYFTMSDHHTFIGGKDSHAYLHNYEGIQNSIRSFVGGKFLVEHFDNMPMYSPYGVNTSYFTPNPNKNIPQHRLLCVANNGYMHNPAQDRKGFGYAIEAAKKLNLPITIAGPENNKLYFQNNPPDYDKLTILYNLSEEELLKVYQQHTIFLHPSELEAGHPNLTLLESMACGLPVVGTLEPNNSLRGMIVAKRDINEIASGIENIIQDYSGYSYAARKQAETLSWENRAKEFISIYEQDTSLRMKKKLVYSYNKTLPIKKVAAPKININNIDGMFAEILGGPSTTYNVKFINKADNSVLYETNMGNNCWARTAHKYYIDWRVEITDLNSSYTYQYDLTLNNARVLICMESRSLGDTLAWMPYIEEFQRKHNCKVICSTFMNDIFKDQYPNIEFEEPGTTVHNLTALYRVGIFYGDNDAINTNMHPSYPMDKPLQQTASDILGLDYTEIRPRIAAPSVDVDEKLITIAIHSTTQAKYWNNPTGWQTVVDYLKAQGYTVKLLSHEPDGYMGNKNPTGVEIHPPSNLQGVMTELKRSKLFIGLGSGLSWLSWTLNVPTMIISGFSDPISEMQDCIRVTAPQSACSGCFNRARLDAGDWNWCPDHKNTPRQFECTKTISADTVIDAISTFLKPKPRIQIKHLLTRLTDTREVLSAQSIKQLKQYGMNYQPIVNAVYDNVPPAEHCRRPHDISTDPLDFQNGLGYLTGRHYGCYLAQRNAIASMDDVNYDYSLIFEADAHIAPDELEEFVNTVYKACVVSERDDVYFVSFARNNSRFEAVDDTFFKTAHHQDLAHCYLISNRHKNWWHSRILDSEWDVADLWLNHVFCNHPQLRYTTQKMLCKQLEGMSLIDKTVKTW
jgi:autotransporter strand-loop-strand O-heptosyltransferase